MSISISTRARNSPHPTLSRLELAMLRTASVTKYAGNPILEAADIPWASIYPEHPQIIRVGNTYHMYFHAGHASDDNYRVGHATATNIYGPWTVDALPILDIGASGSWEDEYVATASVLEIDDVYYMWYSGKKVGGSFYPGLATASAPGGPFTKDAGNPLTGYEGWVGQVVKIGSTYYMTCGGERNLFLGKFINPTGPITPINDVAYTVVFPYEDADGPPWNNVGNMGEAGLVYVDGLYYMFVAGYGTVGAPWPSLQRPYNIGVAFSEDCLTWYEYRSNPIITREESGYDSWRLSEVGAFYEDGVFYVTYTSIGPSPVESLSIAAVEFI